MDQIPVHGSIKRQTERVVISVAQGNKTEGLETRALRFMHRLEHFRHAKDGPGGGLKSDFHEIAGGKLLLKLKQAAGNRYRLEFCARSLASVGMNGSRNGSIELYSGRTPVGVGSGEVGHNQLHYDISGPARADYQSTCPRAYA
jgi:hypothetical protein